MLICPKCESMMETIEVRSPALKALSGSEIDRCLSCKGIWFDRGEDAALMTPEIARALDTGRSDRSVRNNHKQGCLCPRCPVPLESKPFKGQPHIQYESCGSCGGAYFDAGEFRDATTRGVFEWIKAFFRD